MPHTVAIAARCRTTPPVTAAPKRRRQLLLEHHLDESPHPRPEARLDRVKPIRTIKQAGGRRRCAILFHGAISLGALTPSLVVALTRRLRHPEFPYPSRRDPAPRT